MYSIKSIIKKLIGPKSIEKINILRRRIALSRSFYIDRKLYIKHSSVFKKNTYNKIESEITLRYHSIEKGFLYDPIRYRFAKKRVEELLDYLKYDEVSFHINDVQIQSAILNLCVYYELHINNNIDISDYFKIEEYKHLKSNLTLKEQPVKHHTSSDYFNFSSSNFEEFSKSRCSVRSFTGEKISIDMFQKVVKLANQAPTVCNRQGISVNLIDNKDKIDKILSIQGGLRGYSDNLSQLIVLTSDRSYFYSIGERYQLYIDGGIYLMNLLYALHYYEIAACPAHWGMPTEADLKAQEIIGLNESEKIICLIAIGKPVDEFKTTLSLRRSYNENLRVIN
ncbi:MAG: nitroreductase family protein [Bacteroides sp.]|nr:nitroreductase family protein [Bacteroides sp.]